MIDRELWDAINEYTTACGGDTGNATVSPRRMDAVVTVERALQAKQIREFAWLEAGVLDKGEPTAIYPDWVYASRQAVRHANDDNPWLADLLKALGWQGGTIYQALSAVARLVAAEKQRDAKETP